MATIAARNGSSGRTSFSMGSPLIAIPTNRHRPTGGVMWPTAEAITHTMPKWIGMHARFLGHGKEHGNRDEDDLRRRQEGAEQQIERDDEHE